MTSGIDLPWSETMDTQWPDLAAEFLSRPSRGREFDDAGVSTSTAMRALAAAVWSSSPTPSAGPSSHRSNCPQAW